MSKEVEVFSLKTRDEVAVFQNLADAYSVARAGHALKHLSLIAVYDHCQTRADGGKVFAAFLDLFINFLLLWCDSSSVGAKWNANFSKGKLEGGSVLDSQAKFSGKMDVHRFNSSFVLRYRAFWDKLMGFLILRYEPQHYDAFISSKSRRKSFKKLTAISTSIPQHFLAAADKVLNDFDSEFRTPEAHGTGALRKWSFTMESMHKNPQIKLTGYWNIIVQVAVWLGESFCENHGKDAAH